MERIEKISIIGMGALGILYGDFFAEKLGNTAVTFLADGQRIKRYQEQSVYCNGHRCDFQMQDAGTVKDKASLLIFAVKATALEAAIRMARPHIDEDTIILSVLNGISSEAVISSTLGNGQVLYCIAQGMDAVKTGNKLTYAHIGTLCIGVPKQEAEKQAKLEQLAQLFERAGLPYVVEEDILHRLWSKWMLNVGVNQVVMVKEGTYGTIQESGDARELMIAAMEEVIAIAEKEGVPVTHRDLEEYVALVDTLNPEGMPSMRQDGLAKRFSEVELFAGTVIRKAKEYNLDVPVNRELYDTIKELEMKY